MLGDQTQSWGEHNIHIPLVLHVPKKLSEMIVRVVQRLWGDRVALFAHPREIPVLERLYITETVRDAVLEMLKCLLCVGVGTKRHNLMVLA